MPDVGSEFDSAFSLALEAARELHHISPDHELLRLFTETEQDGVWEEFQKRFGKEGISPEKRASAPAQAYFFSQYFLALQEARQEAAQEN